MNPYLMAAAAAQLILGSVALHARHGALFVLAVIIIVAPILFIRIATILGGWLFSCVVRFHSSKLHA